MFDKLDDLLIRFEELMSELSEPDVANNPERFRKLMKDEIWHRLLLHIRSTSSASRILRIPSLCWMRSRTRRCVSWRRKN